MNLTLKAKSQTGNRKLYLDTNGEYYLDCKHCGITHLKNFGPDKKGFVGKRNECTPCRRRTKLERDALGKRTILIVDGVPIKVTYYLVSQSRRFAFKDDNNEIYFVCTNCKSAKHMDDFYLETGALLDTKSTCKLCTDINNRKWEQENYEYFIKTRRLNYQSRIEEIKIQRKNYREKNKKFIAERQKVYREENKEKIFYSKKAYREGNGRELEKARINRWFKENPNKRTYYSLQRFARKKSLPNTLTEEQLLEVLETYNHKCCLSGEEAHIDHVIPLAIGHGGTIYGNILPLSQVLNGSKQDKNIFEWAELVHQHYGFTMKDFEKVISEVAERNDMTLKEYRDYVSWCFNNRK